MHKHIIYLKGGPDGTTFGLKNKNISRKHKFSNQIGLEIRQAQIAAEDESYEQVVKITAERNIVSFRTPQRETV